MAQLLGMQDPTAALVLWVRAGSDGLRNGADPVCQRVFMILMLKAQREGGLTFNVSTVNPAKPHASFGELGLRHCPALVHGEEVIDLQDDIIEYVDATFPRPTLQFFNPGAEDAVGDLFHKFCFYIKEVNKDEKCLNTELLRLNIYLKEEVPAGQKWLTGNVMTHLDCEVLPKLHHIRVAAGALKGYSIPSELTEVWDYLGRAYENDVFVKSCPSDQEILLYWADRKDTPNLLPAKTAELTRQEPVFSFTTPMDKK